MDTYEKDLLNPQISLDDLAEKYKNPQLLYKYQTFYDVQGKENKYWRDNVCGAFHLSLGCEFEDFNDCRPYMCPENVFRIIKNFLQSNNVSESIIKNIHILLKDAMSNDYIAKVAVSWRNDVRIGCFTKSSDNQAMWDKYSNNKTGFCIEYRTEGNKLFTNSTLPVLYLDRPYDTSHGLVMLLLLETIEKSKNRTAEENSKIYQSVYKKVLRELNMHILIKEKIKWEFEQEYRMFILKRRNTKAGLLRAEDILDSQKNINLSKEITAIYLGENFALNENAEQIKKEIICIAQQMAFKVFKKENRSSKLYNKCYI